MTDQEKKWWNWHLQGRGVIDEAETMMALDQLEKKERWSARMVVTKLSSAVGGDKDEKGSRDEKKMGWRW